MKCPRDPDVTLLMTSREGIEIDYCPECRGVWLDRGELDKIIDRSDRDDDDDRDRDRDRSRERDDDRWRVDQPRSSDRDSYKYEKGYPKKKRKGFLSELFEFGD
jgi:Zn-finger nucleic acid-binding protein